MGSYRRKYKMINTYELLPNENNPLFVAGFTGMLITTFYEKNEEENSQSQELNRNSLSCLQERMREVLKQNPWLMGRAKINENAKKIELQVEEGGDEIQKNLDDYILREENDKVFGHDSLNGMREAFSEYRVKNGGDLLDKNEKLACLGIIENQNHSKFCVFISISHMIADACTFYSIYKMLDINQPVISLNRTSPVPDFMNFTRTKTSMFSNKGKSEEPWLDVLKFKQSVLGPLAIKAAKRRMETGGQPECVFAKVNLNEIQKEKQKFQNGDSFVSTNDCLVSMLGEINENADCIDLAMTLRGRVPGVTTNEAGNYIAVPQIRKSGMKNASTVRQFLKDRLDFEKSWDYPQSVQETTGDSAGGVTTNWATFYHQVH